MSPARILEAAEQGHHLQTLARALDALLLTVHQLSLKEQDLQHRVKYAHDEYIKLANHVGYTADENVSQKILHGDTESSSRRDASLNPLEVVNHLQDSGHVQGRMLDIITAGAKCAKAIADQRTANDTDVRSNPCLVAANARSSALERDFTTKGVQGSLHCPFAKVAGKSESTNGTRGVRNPKPSDMCEYDPIKAELSQDRLSSAGFSARSSAARCPIRYLDQHSPEELAQYFENHKHEIPRSHAVCVKRYQKDSGTMDAKYGNMVNMIHGLGQKHKSLLSDQMRNGTPATVSTPAERVEQWAEDVTSKSPHLGALTTVEEDTAEGLSDRAGRFERPLREIRVGESPSRPWGISVPISHQNPPSAVNSPVAPGYIPAYNGLSEIKGPMRSDMPSVLEPQDASPTSTRPPGKCPFDHKAVGQNDQSSNKSPPFTTSERRGSYAGNMSKDPNSADPSPTPETTKPFSSSSPAQMVFNGPVFFGYSAEQAVSLMQQLGSRGVFS